MFACQNTHCVAHSMHRIKNLFEWHEYDIMLMLGVYNVILNV